ncbi:tRNA (N(6)-L-threonylcarbamoyladenosine(37)-C(2))-methylthiotransferase MtaB [Butyrivibrio sp. XB500-5]|uniref:tRNA (N(6)-L-threonylcarbamoyladenosine(37)-C(2))- methylthiotransferase MtaB n=1 Tax=Butyrivibrio sp. XB500-5 TaxID=2364880 RepID=UPI000EA9C777|nr:tRNA (N(6)-L-threonylcarbamoyladenosine(37)-C(2))-methylthiotransferase MtaB [Butyrivibrio sp. XB500-5]RKM60251.1 tRNA (N(6)-L-threonylcarbamoyladenosine(37)-C(2))-methylthiotransferase MtaB [Butyrivibrio sp. XB500-5]
MPKNVAGLKIAMHNLGCKVNNYEMDVMGQKIKEAGGIIVPFSDKADVYIINTCTVTNIADRKSRQMLHKAKKENPEAIVVAVGCYVETGKEGVLKDESIDLAVGNNKKSEIVEILDEFIDIRSVEDDKTLHGTSIIDINHTNEYENMTLSELPEHTRAYIKIQDGCNQFCTYCVIPYARGRVRSRDMKDILDEIKGLVNKGCREVVLTGIHISSYGMENGEQLLIPLIEKIGDIEGIDRIRISSLEPRIMTEENVKRLAAVKKLCPHFHLSLQSGCDSVLARMNRHYTADDFRKGVELLREYFDKPAITTDIIVGFPGETEEEFEECRKFAEEIDFYEMHVFKYSPRKGTVAAGMKDQLTDKEKSARSDVLLDLTKKQSECYRELFIGKELSVLWEDEERISGKRYMIGHTDRYVRIAAPMPDEASENAGSGDITTVIPRAFLSSDTLLI